MTENLLAARYEIMRPLGEGGFAKTYLAKDWQRQRAVCVIKHLTPANSSPQFLGTARRLFKAEAAVLRRLGTHDRIPALWDAFEAEGEFYLVQEFIDGESLHDIFKRQPVFTEAQIIALLTEVLPILAYIHQEQVIHRDIKPSNLMRRYADGKLMLIDFGAVKEITTEFHTASSEQFTVSIGTQGYSAPEQMAGRPRYSSDLYSLGMTVIRGLTGRSPTELPENPHTGELLWEAIAPSVSPGLKVFLQRLTQVSVYQRYPSAAAALDDLAHLDTLAAPPSLDLPPTMLTLSLPAPPPRHRQWLRRAIAPGLVTAIVLLIRQLGGWVPLELALYDQGVQRLTAAARDERLLLVEITEADLQTLQQPTPSDAVLARTLRTLQTYQPTVIGVDLYRDLPQGEGHAELLAALAAENVIAIRKLGVRASEAIAAPRTVTPDRVGINDFPIDADGVVRRNLLFASVNNRPDGEVLYSFGLRLALAYLAREGITPVESALNPDYLALNGTPFVRFDPHFGGYRHADNGGYQLLLQYRGAQGAVARLSLNDVLTGQFTEAMIRDRIIIIGTTAPSAKDLFLTPYSAAARQDFLMPGVMLHVHATSQILSAALDGQRLPWAWPEAVEVGWLLLWAGGGAWWGQRSQRPGRLVGGLLVGGLILTGVTVGAFLTSGWVPLAAPLLAFGGAAIAALVQAAWLPSTALPPAPTAATTPFRPTPK